MSRPLIQIGTEVREMNDAELAQRQLDIQEQAANNAAAANTAKTRETALAKLQALGLTDAEIVALVGA
jgi:hypothetical protein